MADIDAFSTLRFEECFLFVCLFVFAITQSWAQYSIYNNNKKSSVGNCTGGKKYPFADKQFLQKYWSI